MNEPAYRTDPKRYRTVADYVALIRTIEPVGPPGGDLIYSNASYELLGGVVEAVTGRPYHEALREWVLAPAGMTSSGCFVHEPAEGRAVPYTAADDSTLAPALSRMAYRCSPAGGAYATSRDLLRFQRAVVEGRLLDEHHTRLLLNRFEEGAEGAGRFGFIGGTYGVNSWVETELASGVTAIVLTNLDPPSAERVMLGLRQWLREHPVDG